MKILIDIGHPGHVHYFKNLIIELGKMGNEVVITARNRGIVFLLLEKFNIKYLSRGRGGNTKISKLLYIFVADYILLKLAIKKNIDIFVSFSSPYAAHVSTIMQKPHITLNDTEHTDNIHGKFTYPFSSVVITPSVYQNDLGFKHIKFNSIVEGLYLHDEYYTPDMHIVDELGVRPDEKFIVIRFVSWQAHHDYAQSGLSLASVRDLIDFLGGNYKIFISSEVELPADLKEYEIKLSPEKMHDILYYASLFIGESATMASESAFLGTSSVYINSLPLMGYLALEEQFGILKHFKSSDGVLQYVSNLLQQPNFDDDAKQRSNEMKEKFINPTKFLSWFVDSYPESIRTVRDNPKYQFKF